MSAAEYTLHGHVAVIYLNNPPVNSLGLALRQKLFPALQSAEHDPAVKAVVLTGSDKAFCGGADIREFNTDKCVTRPGVHDILDHLDAVKKPVIAAIGGFALGGGLEVALACHYRVALPGTRLALPEVTLGVIAGGGGIQRLPRIISLERATEMVLSGSPIPVAEAKKLGMLDEIIEGDLLAGALHFAEKLVADGKGPRRVRDMPPKVGDAKSFFAAKRSELQKTARGRVTPLATLESLEVSVTRPFDEGQAHTIETFSRLSAGVESRALRHGFFAEREAAKVMDVPAGTPLRSIAKAAVIGAGTMGGGIAMCFANAGIPVTIIDTGQEALDRGLASIHRNYTATVARGRLVQADMDRRVALISTALQLPMSAGRAA